MTQEQILEHIVFSHFFIDTDQIALRMRYIRNTMLLIKKSDEDGASRSRGISPDMFTTIVQWVHDRLLIDEYMRHLRHELTELIEDTPVENDLLERLAVTYGSSKNELYAIASTIRDNDDNEIELFDQFVHLMTRASCRKEKLEFFLAEINYIRAVLFLAFATMRKERRSILKSIKHDIEHADTEIRELEDVVRSNEENIAHLRSHGNPALDEKIILLEDFIASVRKRIDLIQAEKTVDEIIEEVKRRYRSNPSFVNFRRRYAVVKRELESLDVLMDISSVVTQSQTACVAG